MNLNMNGIVGFVDLTQMSAATDTRVYPAHEEWDAIKTKAEGEFTQNKAQLLTKLFPTIDISKPLGIRHSFLKVSKTNDHGNPVDLGLKPGCRCDTCLATLPCDDPCIPYHYMVCQRRKKLSEMPDVLHHIKTTPNLDYEKLVASIKEAEKHNGDFRRRMQTLANIFVDREAPKCEVYPRCRTQIEELNLDMLITK